MRRACRWRNVVGLTLALGLSGTLGCQTWEGGMTLPSPRYLQDRPDYIPHAPAFPLGRELASMKAAAAGVGPVGGAAAPPAIPPGAPVPVP
jgi:hypothetical protein